VSQCESPSPDDAIILACIGRREPDSLALLYDRYGGRAFSLAYSILRDRQLAEDVVQEAFLSVWRRAETFNAERGTVRAWLFTIVHHQAINHVRTIRARGGLATDIDALVWLADSTDTAATVERGWEGEQVRKAVGTLSREQRQVVVLAYFGGLSQSEIARFIAIPLGTVKGRMRLALENLRGALPHVDTIADQSQTQYD
jgi:RNA polymerase sigma factor (sigma-70 family)